MTKAGTQNRNTRYFIASPPAIHLQVTHFILGQQHEMRKLTDHIAVCFETRG